MIFRPTASPLQAARLGAGLSLRRLAERSRVHYLRIHYFEHGLRPREDEARRLAGVLGVAVDALLPKGEAHV